MFSGIYNGKKVLVTGHTGFKGSWLALWLRQLGADVTGIALDPDTDPAHWNLLGLDAVDVRGDVRDRGFITATLQEAAPEIVFHLAAQPLVRRSYRKPVETFAANVMGTAHVLDAVRSVPSVKAVVVITTDKCYQDNAGARGYIESDPLGGHDPYSASKACAELVADSYRKSFFSTQSSPLLATARAGNVIGGGDWAEDRLIPDLVRCVASGEPLVIRSPRATRPWQHVLESLSGYLLLGQRLLEGKGTYAGAWNFGPDTEGNDSVENVLTSLNRHWPGFSWVHDDNEQLHEAALLHLDSSKARQELAWQPVWSLDEALSATAEWYRQWIENSVVISGEQLGGYIEKARSAGVVWAGGV